MNTRDTSEYYLAFISIVFGIFIAVWAQPLIDTFKPEKGPLPGNTKDSQPEQLKDGGTNARPPIDIATRPKLVNLKDMGRYPGLQLAQGGLTLLIIVCLWWWYGVFLRAFAPAEGFFMYLYDFLSLGIFAVAAGIWRDTTGRFALVVLLASIAVWVRFLLAWKKTRRYRGANQALKVATWTVMGVVALGLTFNAGFIARSLYDERRNGSLIDNFDETTLGVYLVVVMAACLLITVLAVRKTEGIGWGRWFVLDSDAERLIDPFLSPIRNCPWPDPRLMENRCRAALREFEERCIDCELYKSGTTTSSEVHSPHDLHCQAKLAVYASDGTSLSISKRVQMMYFVHWFDDLMDQGLARNLLPRCERDYEAIFRGHLASAKKLADHYRNFFAEPKDFEAGLIRLVFGGVLFRNGESTALRQKHKQLLKGRGVSEELLSGFDVVFVDLTVKTVMEFWFGLEEPLTPPGFEYAFLYSLLYGPALYYHDHREERKAGELRTDWSLNENDTAAMIRKVGKRIEERIDTDAKAPGRAQEVLHFVLCFGDVVPPVVKSAYDEVAGALLTAVECRGKPQMIG